LDYTQIDFEDYIQKTDKMLEEDLQGGSFKDLFKEIPEIVKYK